MRAGHLRKQVLNRCLQSRQVDSATTSAHGEQFTGIQGNIGMLVRIKIAGTVFVKETPGERLKPIFGCDDDGGIADAGSAANHPAEQAKQKAFIQVELDGVIKGSMVRTKRILIPGSRTGRGDGGHGKPSSDKQTCEWLRSIPREAVAGELDELARNELS